VAELLKIYLQYDLIEEAVDLSTEFLTAVTGSTFEKFGLEVCVMFLNTPQYTAIFTLHSCVKQFSM